MLDGVILGRVVSDKVPKISWLGIFVGADMVDG